MGELIEILLRCGAGAAAGVVSGCSSVWFFNRIPGRWLCNYNEEPDEELLHPTEQRIKSVPWKYLMSALFCVTYIWLFMGDLAYGISGAVLLWLLAEIAMADAKYSIIPDQLIYLVILTGISFISFKEDGLREALMGAGIGAGFMALIVIMGFIAYRKMTIGGGDIKLIIALGLVLGPAGIAVTIVGSTMISAAHFIWKLMRKKAKLTDKLPMGPYIAVSAGIYVVLLHEMSYNIVISF